MVWPGAPGPSRWSSVTWIVQPPAGAGPAGGDVAAERDEHPGRAGVVRGPGTAVGGQRLGRRAEVQRHTRGQRHPRRVAGHLNLLPARPPAPVDGDPAALAQRRAGRHRDQLVPVAVIAERDEVGGERRVHRAVGGVGGVDGEADSLREQRAHGQRARTGTGRRVQPAQLGVLAKAAGGRVDGIKLALDGRPCGRIGRTVVAQQSGGAEGVPRLGAAGRRGRDGRCVTHHEPPETAGAGADWGTGAGCGAGAAEVVVTWGAVVVTWGAGLVAVVGA